MKKNKALPVLMMVIVGVLFALPLLAAEAESTGFDWWKLISDLLPPIIIAVIGILLTRTAELWRNKVKIKELAIAIATISDDYVKSYLAENPGAKVAQVISWGLSAFVDRLTKMFPDNGEEKNNEMAERVLKAAYYRATKESGKG